MRLIASQFLLLSVALAVSGQSFNCWYLQCDDYATGSLQQSVEANGQINQYQSSQSPIVQKVESNQFKPILQNYVISQVGAPVATNQKPAQTQHVTWIENQQPIKTPNVANVETSQQYVYLPQTFVTSQPEKTLNVQPSQSQYTIISQQPIERPVAPKIETSYQYVAVPQKFVASNPETTVNKQPAQSQYSAWTQQQIQHSVAPKVETTYQYFSLPQTVVTSQTETSTNNKQPTQSQFPAWTQEPVKSTVAPKIETSYQYVAVPQKFVASNPETTVNKQPAQSQYSAWSVQTPQVSTHQYISPSQNIPAIQFATLNDQQIQYPTWIINQQPIQSQETPKTDSAKQYYINSQQSTQNLESTHQYISLPQNLIANSESIQSPVSTMTVNQQPSIAGNIDYFYQQPNRFLVNFVSYPIQETSQSQVSASVGPKPVPVNANLPKNEGTTEKPVAVSSVNVNTDKPGEIVANSANIINEKTEAIAPAETEKKPSPSLIIAEESKVQAESQQTAAPLNEKTESLNEVPAEKPAEKPVESPDTPQVNSTSETPANQE